MESKIDSNTASIVLNNPSNPCGSSYSCQHLLDILTVAERHRLPIISDDTYAWMVSKQAAVMLHMHEHVNTHTTMITYINVAVRSEQNYT